MLETIKLIGESTGSEAVDKSPILKIEVIVALILMKILGRSNSEIEIVSLLNETIYCMT